MKFGKIFQKIIVTYAYASQMWKIKKNGKNARRRKIAALSLKMAEWCTTTVVKVLFPGLKIFRNFQKVLTN